MTAFDAYADSYDLLYEDKDYPAETVFVLDRLRAATPAVHDVLELGCGTGAHAEVLATEGIRVHGIDLSPAMVARAEARRARLPREQADRLSFGLGDARGVRVDRRFDAVVSLFHVMSYLVSDDAFADALTTAEQHLRPGGVFLFDFWHGPAVLTDPPVVRVKRVEGESMKLTRLAEPVVRHDRNVVEVDYQLFLERKATGQVDQVHESHHLRYWFWPEIQRSARAAGLEPLGIWKWMTSEPAGADAWLAYVVCRKPLPVTTPA